MSQYQHDGCGGCLQMVLFFMVLMLFLHIFCRV